MNLTLVEQISVTGKLKNMNIIKSISFFALLTKIKQNFFIVLIIGFTISCVREPKETRPEIKVDNKFETTEFDCDTIYPKKRYKITLTKFDTLVSEYDTIYNTFFT